MTKKSLAVIVACVLVVLVGSVAVFAASLPAMDEAREALEQQDNDTITITRIFVVPWLKAYYAFEPIGRQPEAGFIFYPGGLVEPEAYAPFLRAIAEQGYSAYLAPMPFDLALFGWKRATTVIMRSRAIEKWAIGGHSLGGVAACRYAGKYARNIDGVVLWASYPSETFRIEESGLPVMSIYGTNDGLSTPAKIDDNRPFLPPDTEYIEIEGGNHTQFGWYNNDELQEGDLPADISRQEQQDQTVEATARFLDNL
jgi:hypothetical protein